MRRPFCRPRRSDLRVAAPGWTLFELCVALAIIGIMAIGLMQFAETGPEETVDLAATRLQRAMVTARAGAITQAGDWRLYVEPNVGGGRFLAAAVPTGADTSGIGPNDWITLPVGAVFGTGVATAGPLGDPVTGGVPTTAAVCQGVGVCFFSADTSQVLTTFYLAHRTVPSAVRALVLTKVGDVRVYRLRSGGTWE